MAGHEAAQRTGRPTVGNQLVTSAQESTMYERVGGSAWFTALVERFYRAVATDAVLRPLYPGDAPGLEAAADHLRGFLIQYWGGPPDYSAERGHPRLRMRHGGFRIGAAERDAWYGHMADAVRAGGLDAGDEAEMLDYFAMAATHLINTG
jgi:hemoglobin